MALNEQDREDLMREASGLSPRAEITSPAFPDNVIFGFKRQGGLSIYFGAHTVYQFNSAGELRRAYIDGSLLKAEGGRLIVMRRERTGHEVTLWATELTEAQTTEILGALDHRLAHLRKAMEKGESHVVAEVPHGADAVERFNESLSAIASPPTVAQRANSS
jgi:hypothetical protein